MKGTVLRDSYIIIEEAVRRTHGALQKSVSNPSSHDLAQLSRHCSEEQIQDSKEDKSKYKQRERQ